MALCVEDLGHADFLTDKTFLHVYSSFGYWLGLPNMTSTGL